MSQLYGVDVSHYQEAINWPVANGHVNFVLIQATYGTDVDPQFKANQVGARLARSTAGPLGVGYYHFAYPTLLTADTSARFFVSTVGKLEEGEVLALDIEGTLPEDIVAWALDWLQIVEALTGVKAWVYLNDSVRLQYDWKPVESAGFGLWRAHYDNDKEGADQEAAPWAFSAAKQWTSVDSVDGIPGKVDGDTFYGDFDQFYAYGYKAVPIEITQTPVAEATSTEEPPAEQPATDQASSVPKSVDSITAPSSDNHTPLAVKITSTSDLEARVKALEDWLSGGEQEVTNWLGTTWGGFISKLVLGALGWLAANAGVLHANPDLVSIFGVIVGQLVQDHNNPSVPNTTKP